MIKTVVFDLDGTLLDTAETISHHGNEALKKYGYPPLEVATYKSLLGNGAKVLVEKMLAAVQGRGEDFQGLYRDYNRLYEENPGYLTKIFPGIEEVLKALQRKKFRLGVLTNKPHGTTIKVVEELFGGTFFDGVQGQEEGLPRKPDPAMMERLLKKMKVDREGVLYVGDSEVDLNTGSKAGVPTLLVDWGFRSREELEALGGRVLSHPKELLDFIEEGGK